MGCHGRRSIAGTISIRRAGRKALEDRPSQAGRIWNRIPGAVRERIIALALEQSELSPRELAVRFSDTQGYFVSEASVYRLLKEDVTYTLEMALTASGCDQAHVRHKPRLLSDNGSIYVSGDLAEWLDKQRMDHALCAPYHPQTQGKIERWHQTLKNRILLENYYLPGDLEAQIGRFIKYYNHNRHHESLDNLTQADVYFRRGQAILQERHRIKQKTIEHRRLIHRKLAA